MATARGETGHEDRVALPYLVVDKVEPFVDTVLVTLADISTACKTEVLRVGLSAEVCARRGTPSHLHRLPAVEHEVGHGGVSPVVCVAVVAVVCVAHVVPVDDSVARYSLSRHGLPGAVGKGVVVCVRGYDGFCFFGEPVEVHDLCHRRCRASCSRILVFDVVLIGVVVRASEVVGMPLVPSCGEDFADAVLRVGHLVALR